ncbi:ABC transporter ATP-binding protein [Pseudoflavonifractor phocaeensis]|uniref:ABC transporter ATP-binding protein n=1 Tax=Pseudoflavonifractor phocaeensis TaxID=1870988 RepID=UPI0025A36C74|nr:ABC transporter ATP-binding protein [Pseudoflavonifractor phocaeensis]MDM8238546.1 ABC transporter ATP-binding protein [Pseudoflavonifractor phocaeensis]
MALLEMQQICKAFSGVYANDHVDLTVEKGEIHALLGENGAGKTTLMNILFGIYSADSGQILWKGQPVRFASPKDAIAAGIGMVQQHFSLVRKMTVLDNIILNLRDNRFVLDRKQARQRVCALAEKYGLTVDPDAQVGNLSVGEQQRVEILKALYRDVELLILDEPTGVLTPQETAQFFEVLRALQKEGYGIIIITHRMSEIMAISDRVTILRDGKKVAQLVTAQTQPDELSRHMIGRELNESYDVDTPPGEETLLSLEAISLPRKKKGHPLHDITLELRRGEILGVAGVEGNGQKELAEIITGIQHPSQGRVILDGQEIQRETVRQRYEQGVVYISDDRLNDSLVTDMDLTENLMLRDYCRAPFSHKGLLDRKAMLQTAKEKIQRYQVRSSGTSGEATPVRLLSGGNQQKLIVAREITDRAQVVVASQPTRGLDIGATEFVRDRLVEQRNAGKGVLLISADLEEIMALSDRIAVLFGGRIVGVLTRQEATVEQIGLLMGGITGKEAVR